MDHIYIEQTFIHGEDQFSVLLLKNDAIQTKFINEFSILLKLSTFLYFYEINIHPLVL